MPLGIAESRGVECRRNHFARGAAGIEAGVLGDAPLHHFAEGRGELAGFFRTDEPRQRLLDDFVRPETEQRINRVVGLENLAFQVGNEHRVGGVFNQAFRIGPGFVEFPHVAENPDRPDHPPVHIAEGRGVEAGGNDFARRRARMQHGVARHAVLDNLAKGGGELAGFLRTDEPGQRLLEHLVLPKTQQLGNRIVGLEDFAFQVGDEHRVRGIFNQAFRIRPGFVEFPHVAEDPDRPDHLAVRVPEGRRV